MNDCVKSIYIYWVGLSKKNKAHDIKGLPLPIPIKDITKEKIIIDIRYTNKHNIDTGRMFISGFARSYQQNLLKAIQSNE